VKTETVEYRAEQDTVGSFLPLFFVEKTTGRVSKADVRAAYEQFCDSEGYKHFSAKRFSQEMTRRGYTEVRLGDAGRCWQGLDWKPRI
jgi:phage/plasmid-associated DNA primase